MASPILGTPSPQFVDSSGAPLASGTITTLDPADDSVKASYPTADDADAGTNGTSGDITLDASGRPSSTQYWGKDGEDYKVVIKDSDATTVLTMDDIKMPLKVRRSLTTFSSADATPSVAEGTMFRLNDTTITDFDDGQVGDIIHIYGPASGHIEITNGSSVFTRDGLDVRLGVADTITFAMFVDQAWHEIGRSWNNSGTSFEVVSSANTLTEAESGAHYFLNAAGGFATTLPAPVVGCRFKFSVKTAPTTAYTIGTNGGSNIIYGSIHEADGTAAAVSAQDTINFVASTSLVGDWVELVCDGTNWHLLAFTSAGGGITATAS